VRGNNNRPVSNNINNNNNRIFNPITENPIKNEVGNTNSTKKFVPNPILERPPMKFNEGVVKNNLPPPTNNKDNNQITYKEEIKEPEETSNNRKIVTSK